MISREEKWAQLAFAKNSGIVIGDSPVSYWSIFPLSLVTVPEVFAKVNSAQFLLFSKVANNTVCLGPYGKALLPLLFLM